MTADMVWPTCKQGGHFFPLINFITRNRWTKTRGSPSRHHCLLTFMVIGIQSLSFMQNTNWAMCGWNECGYCERL